MRVDLSVMPAEVVERCRAAWAPLAERKRTVVHGDPGESNIFITDDGPVLIDWDEARVDAPLFDLAALPADVTPLTGDDLVVARRASWAWEAAISWQGDRDYARWNLSRLDE